MSTQNIAIERAIQLLNAAGAQFKIIAKDGAEYGALQTKEVPKRMRSGFDFKAIYQPEMRHMKPSDVVTISAPSGMPVELLRGAAAAFASTQWGNGAHISSVKGSDVEILRVA